MKSFKRPKFDKTSAAPFVPWGADLEGRRTIVARGASSAGEAAVDAYPVPGAKMVSLDVQPGPTDSGRPADRFLVLICGVS